MVSYKKLNPEDVQFSSTVLSEESRPAQEEVAVSSYQVSFFSAALSIWGNKQKNSIFFSIRVRICLKLTETVFQEEVIKLYWILEQLV